MRPVDDVGKVVADLGHGLDHGLAHVFNVTDVHLDSMAFPLPLRGSTPTPTERQLISAGLHGHKYTIDAAVAEMALRQQRPVVLLTSDVDDMTKPCGGRVGLVPV